MFLVAWCSSLEGLHEACALSNGILQLKLARVQMDLDPPLHLFGP